jgi:hypothetical protein
MSCELCGGGDRWIKTCLTPSGSRLLVCDGPSVIDDERQRIFVFRRDVNEMNV